MCAKVFFFVKSYQVKKAEAPQQLPAPKWMARPSSCAIISKYSTLPVFSPQVFTWMEARGFDEAAVFEGGYNADGLNVIHQLCRDLKTAEVLTIFAEVLERVSEDVVNEYTAWWSMPAGWTALHFLATNKADTPAFSQNERSAMKMLLAKRADLEGSGYFRCALRGSLFFVRPYI